MELCAIRWELSADDAVVPLLRPDPWTAPLEAMAAGEGWQEDDPEEEDPSRRLDLTVELPPEEWQPIDGRGDLVAIAFVDGVCRVEAGLAVWTEAGPIWALMGACAAGAVLCTPGSAEVVAQLQDRLVVIGMRRVPEGTAVLTVGSSALRYRLVAAGAGDRRSVHRGLLSAMRQLEAEVAGSLPLPQGGVIVLDGLLPFHPHHEMAGRMVVGMIKEHRRLYLHGTAPLACLRRLGTGQRTPLFLMERDRPPARLYSWYQRVAPAGPVGHALRGIVRLEAWAEGGIEQVRRIADLLAGQLPLYAPDGYRDRRAPANPYPVLALEEHLRRSLGDGRWIRRQVQAALAAFGGPSSPKVSGFI
ncbi:hypothetical protein HRbin24_00150 [bacterium HR24]|nr:hypothetical protein HRbin24_00150 [bacterium HR24]